MLYCDIRGHHGKNGIMNQVIIIWVEEKENEYFKVKMKIQTVQLPLRNLIAINRCVAIGVWAYFGIVERLNVHSTKLN